MTGPRSVVVSTFFEHCEHSATSPCRLGRQERCLLPGLAEALIFSPRLPDQPLANQFIRST